MTAQAALKQNAVITSGEEAPSSKRSSQRVALSKRELDLYIQDGRPTGALFSSVAVLKGLSSGEIAKRSGVPASVTEVVLKEGAQADLKISAIQGVAQTLGINLAELRMTDGQVHIFNVSRLTGAKGAAGFSLHERGVGLLMRGAVVIKIDAAKPAGMNRGRFEEFHAAQMNDARAVFVSSSVPLLGRRFDPSMIPSARWACGTEVKSKLDLPSEELSTQLFVRDLNRVEFDQMFRGQDTVSWDEIRSLVRANNITRSEVAEMIRNHASGGSLRKRSRADRRASLRLVSAAAGDE